MEINQKYLYLGESADLYYKSDSYQLTDLVFIKFIRRFISDNKISHLISLGCGNSYEEMTILSKLKKNIKYTGVDFSSRMIELSRDVLDKNKIQNYELIVSDFFNPEIYTERKERTLYYSSGYTMCNLNSEDWAKLINLIPKYNYFAFYVLSMDDPFSYQELIEQSIDNLCDNEIKIKQYLEGLKTMGLSKEDGVFIQETYLDELSMVIRYNFKINDEKKIKVQDIRIYDIERIIHFFHQNNFQLIKKKINIDTCIYLFQKM